MQKIPVIPTACANWTEGATACTSKGSVQCAGCKLVLVSAQPYNQTIQAKNPSIADRSVKRLTGGNTRKPANLHSANPAGVRLGTARIGTQHGPVEMLPLISTTLLDALISICGETYQQSTSFGWGRTKATNMPSALLCCLRVCCSATRV
jgi:hypothetical protein